MIRNSPMPPQFKNFERKTVRFRWFDGLLMLLGIGVGPLEAALEANFVTSAGTVTVELEYASTPKAVANFIILAKGSRAWVDPLTGAVKTNPFYDGLSFYRVENVPTSRIVLAGSPRGDGSDDPGYTFQDELHPALHHEPYVMGMSNDGPNTNGCGFYLTGDISLEDRDGINVVFGKIPSAASRAVVDTILAAGPGSTTILSIGFNRTDPGAQGFDELAVVLPTVHGLAGKLQVDPGVAVALDFPQPVSTVIQAYSGTSLSDWKPHYRSFVGIDDPAPATPLVIDAAPDPARFYYFSLTENPNAGGATGFANRTLVIDTPGTGEIIYEFDSTGLAGTYDNTPIPGAPLNFNGNFEVLLDQPPRFDAYSFEILVELENFGGAPVHLIKGGYDEIEAIQVTGRQLTRFLSADMTPVFDDGGPFRLSRP